MDKKQMIQDKIVYLLNHKETQGSSYNLIDQESNQIPEHLRFLVNEINDSFLELQRFAQHKDEIREKGRNHSIKEGLYLESFDRFYEEVYLASLSKFHEEIHDTADQKLNFNVTSLLRKEDKRIRKEKEEMIEKKNVLEKDFKESLDRYWAHLKKLVDITEFFLDHYEIPDFFEVAE